MVRNHPRPFTEPLLLQGLYEICVSRCTRLTHLGALLDQSRDQSGPWDDATSGSVWPVHCALWTVGWGNLGASGGRKGIRHQAIEGLSNVRAVAAAEHLGVDVERRFRVLVADLATNVVGATISRLVKQGRVRRLDQGGYAVVEASAEQTAMSAASPEQPTAETSAASGEAQPPETPPAQ